jgi:hypothetical protein
MDQLPAQVPIATLRCEREAAVQQVGLLYKAHASSAAIKEAIIIGREACIAFECDKHLEQAGFNPSEPCTTVEQGEDHNHPLGAEDMLEFRRILMLELRVHVTLLQLRKGIPLLTLQLIYTTIQSQ